MKSLFLDLIHVNVQDFVSINYIMTCFMTIKL